MTINYSIIITFYQNINMLTVCLQNLIPTLNDNAEVEIIIVNDNPQIDLKEVIRDFSKQANIIFVENTKNMGYSAACNRGAEYSNGKFLIFLDCDIIVTPSWLTALQKSMCDNDNCGAVASTILDMANNQIVYAGMSLYLADTIKPFQGGYLTNQYVISDQKSEIVTSGCMMMDKEKFNQVNGFDERLYNSCCDLDLSMKLNAASWNNYISAHSIVYHRGNVSGEIRFSSHTYSRTHFFMTWSETIKANSNLNLLKHLYSFTPVRPAEYLILDFSTSPYSADYIKCLSSLPGIKCIDVYKIHPSLASGAIFLTDYLTWDICSLNVPIIYFADDYRKLINNFLWFKNRNCRLDYIIDKNGNIYSLTQD